MAKAFFKTATSRSGLLVPNRDVPAMTRAIRQLAADAGMRWEFSAVGRAFVRHKFRPESSYLQLGQLYQQVIGR